MGGTVLVGYDLTPKQQEIVELCSRFRFINRIQIQKILNHKDARRINAWLKDLVGKNYLGRIYSHKLLENTKPAIYYLSYTGIRYKQQRKSLALQEVKKFYEDKNASRTFIDHCIAVVEFFTAFKEKEKKTKYSYSFFTKTDIWNNEYLKKLRPDAYVEKTTKSDKAREEKRKKVRFFIDLFDPHVPRYALRYRITQYLEFHDSYEWGEFAPGAKFPYILLILPTQQKLNHLGKHIQEQLNESYDVEDMRFMLTTTEKVAKEGIGAPIWETVQEE